MYVIGSGKISKICADALSVLLAVSPRVPLSRLGRAGSCVLAVALCRLSLVTACVFCDINTYFAQHKPHSAHVVPLFCGKRRYAMGFSATFALDGVLVLLN